MVMKLVIYDHNGQQQFQSDVFVEGQDFEYTSSRPMALWLGTIKLISEKRFNEEHGIRAIESFPEKLEEQVETDAKMDAPREQQDVAAEKEAQEVADEEQVPFTTPSDTTQETQTEEVTNEPEASNNQGTGDIGISEASKPKSTKKLSPVHSRGKAAKGGKEPRKRKTT